MGLPYSAMVPIYSSMDLPYSTMALLVCHGLISGGNSIQGEIPECSPLSVDTPDIVVWTVNLDTVELMNLCVQGTEVGQACIEHNDGRGWQVKYMSRP